MDTNKNLKRYIFIIASLVVILALTLSACAPAQGLEGGGGQGNGGGNGNGNGGGGGNDNGNGGGGGNDNGNGGGGGNDNGGGGGNDNGGGGGGGGNDNGNGNTEGTGDPNVQNPNGVDVRGSKEDPSDPCLDAGELPCGQGDHGKGNPVNGSLHANCVRQFLANPHGNSLFDRLSRVLLDEFLEDGTARLSEGDAFGHHARALRRRGLQVGPGPIAEGVQHGVGGDGI